MQRIFVPNDHIVRISPALVMELGDMAEAVLLLQMEYWVANDSKHGFTTKSIRAIQDTLPFWSMGHISQTLQKLCDKGLLMVIKDGAKTRKYTLGPEVASLKSVHLVNTDDGQCSPREHTSVHGVNNKETKSSSSDTSYPQASPATVPPKRSAREKVQVLGDVEKFVDFILASYPPNKAGVRPTRAQVLRAAARLGEVSVNANAEQREKAMAELRLLGRAVKNLAAAVDSGEYERQYVPNFDKFSGAGVRYGEEPRYRNWGEREAPKEAPKLVY